MKLIKTIVIKSLFLGFIFCGNLVYADLYELADQIENQFFQKDFTSCSRIALDVEEFIKRRENELFKTSYCRCQFIRIQVFLRQGKFALALQLIHETSDLLVYALQPNILNGRKIKLDEIYNFLTYSKLRNEPEIHCLLLFYAEYLHNSGKKRYAHKILQILLKASPVLEPLLKCFLSNQVHAEDLRDYTSEGAKIYASCFETLFHYNRKRRLIREFESALLESDWNKFQDLASLLENIVTPEQGSYYKFKTLVIKACLAQRLYEKAYHHIKSTIEYLLKCQFVMDENGESEALFRALTEDQYCHFSTSSLREKYPRLMILLAEYYTYMGRFYEAECILAILLKTSSGMKCLAYLALAEVKYFQSEWSLAKSYYNRALTEAEAENALFSIRGLVYLGIIKVEISTSPRVSAESKMRLERAKLFFEQEKYAFGLALVEFYQLQFLTKECHVPGLEERLQRLESIARDELCDPFFYALILHFKTEVMSCDDNVFEELRNLNRDSESIPLLNILTPRYHPDYFDDALTDDEALSQSSSSTSKRLSHDSPHPTPRSTAALLLKGTNQYQGQSTDSGSDLSLSGSTSITSPRSSHPDSPSLSRSSSQKSIRSSPVRIPGSRVHTLKGSGEF